jgi:lysozyme
VKAPDLRGKPMTAWLAACVFCVGAAEGLRTVAYRDPVGIPTVCFGETVHPEGRPVRIGDTATVEQCEARLMARVKEFGDGIDECVAKPLPASRKAAYTSLAYNIGLPAFCKSTLVRKEKAGDIKGACDEIARWNKAKGVELPGLTKRRAVERELCLQSLPV